MLFTNSPRAIPTQAHATASPMALFYKMLFIISPFQVRIVPIKQEDSVVQYGEAGNYSVTGFEMILTRNTAK